MLVGEMKAVDWSGEAFAVNYGRHSGRLHIVRRTVDGAWAAIVMDAPDSGAMIFLGDDKFKVRSVSRQYASHD